MYYAAERPVVCAWLGFIVCLYNTGSCGARRVRGALDRESVKSSECRQVVSVDRYTVQPLYVG